MTRKSISRLRGKNKNKCDVLNRRFESIVAEINFDDELALHPELQNTVDDTDINNVNNNRRTRSSLKAKDEAAEFDKRSAVAAERLIKDCYMSRAMKRLCKKNEKRTKSFSAVLNDLRHLHPQSNHSIPPLPSDSPTLVVDPDDLAFFDLLKSMDNGSSPGLSGMTGNMLAILADDIECRRYIAQFTAAVINGQLPDCIRRVLLASHLIGIPKSNNGTRPIAIGEILYRFASRYALSLVDKHSLHEIFLPHQFGVNVAAGCESVVHFVQQALDNQSEPYYALCIDMKNAFNEVKRDEMINTLFEHRTLSALYRLAHWCYSEPTSLIT
jgi:hypothetical protein